MKYRIVAKLGAGLVVIDRGGVEHMWSRGKCRKPAKCAVLGEVIPKGAVAFRPVNQSVAYRYERVSVEAVEWMLSRARFEAEQRAEPGPKVL